jgi:hypothetical protein
VIRCPSSLRGKCRVEGPNGIYVPSDKRRPGRLLRLICLSHVRGFKSTQFVTERVRSGVMLLRLINIMTDRPTNGHWTTILVSGFQWHMIFYFPPWGLTDTISELYYVSHHSFPSFTLGLRPRPVHLTGLLGAGWK